MPAIPVPTKRFSYVHINIVGPLPSSQGFSYLLTMIDRRTCWLEVASISAESCVQTFLFTWVSRFGVPAVLTSDRGAQFTSSVWFGVCSSHRNLDSTTTSFHPQSNRMIEQFHHSLKAALCSHEAGSDWFLHMPLVLLGLRAVSEAITFSGKFLRKPELPLTSFLCKI